MLDRIRELFTRIDSRPNKTSNQALNGEVSFIGGSVQLGMRITCADARLNVPESFSQNMNMLQNFLPLVQEGNRWYLRRN
ncbi:MAG: hypothetical protein IJP54_01230 [Synergistaceae bacterium]|nr:hypothetical protein [Synergistaceae bacterium]MBR0034272.1 hypothetical protein [Synergistaceae bacterium]